MSQAKPKHMKNKECIWDKLPLSDLPNCWTEEGKSFVSKNPSIKEYILNLKFEERKDYKKLSIEDKCKVIGKFYDPKGDPAPYLMGGDVDYFLFNSLIQF